MGELKDAITYANENSPERKFLHALMSKPDVLKNWQDDLTTDRHPLPSVPAGTVLESRRRGGKHQVIANRGLWGCRSYRRVIRWSFGWLMFTRFDESIIDFHHEPGCSKYQKTGTSHEHTSSILYTGLLQQFLNIAMVASFTRCNGAGGASIGSISNGGYETISCIPHCKLSRTLACAYQNLRNSRRVPASR
ncbi:hypothetical protein GGR53DRAFT_493933 [Hypoxylon sp. FL1150]|nr:hypothetical protein GGR53DRAFT_493933 [Hypoxylon sp. FL1150]